MKCRSCEGALLPLPSETVRASGLEATFDLAACLRCGTLDARPRAAVPLPALA